MYKLLNRSDFSTNEELEKDWKRYKKYGIDFFELIKYSDRDNISIKDKVKGYHLRFFPTWLDWYLSSEEEITQRYDEKLRKSLLGGVTKGEMLDYYKKELKRARDLEVEYVVLHCCNVDIFESMTYDFRFSDVEILEKVVESVNEIFVEDYGFTLLLENLWWSGLKLTNRAEVEYLIENIRYKNIGFMLDTGHLLNTNLELRNSQEGVEYILKCIENLGEYKKYIYGLHLNYSLSGEYVKKSIQLNRERNLNIETVLQEVYYHIEKIDYHTSFEDEGINKIISLLPLRYLVYEFIARSEEEIERNIFKQNSVLDFYKK